MFCKNCGTEISEGTMFCPNCGASQNAPVQTPVIINQPVANMPMAFNNFYKYFLIVIGALSILGILANKDKVSLAAMLVPAYEIVTGILLIGWFKAGYIMTKIMNIFNIISGGIGCVVSLLFAVIGGAAVSYFDDLASVGGAIVTVICVSLLIGFAISIVINALILRYYNKRKEYFVK